MFHMLSWFDLKPEEDIKEFRTNYLDFVEQMLKLDLVVSTGPIGCRDSNTPMDTDHERSQQYFVIMDFRDRLQVDTAYAHIMKHMEPEESTHNAMLDKVINPYFICWQDIE